jgi:aminopeptidase YwaD
MRSITFLICTLPFFFNLKSQDTVYARRIIHDLCSEKFYGRGYLKNGLDGAARYISDKIKQNQALTLFATGYYQWFDFDVNTFPDKVIVKINNKLLKPGIDYIIQPQSGNIKGKYKMNVKDSLRYEAEDDHVHLSILLKRKLTYSVASKSIATCSIDLLYPNKFLPIKTAEVNIQSKVLTKYINKNICAYIPGKSNTDSMIVFSAHYDHLGGMGKKTFFPGANDNASGVSLLLDLMRHYQKYPPKYKTVFLFFAGEEAGLLGSRYFVESKVLDLKKIKFLINLDLLGTGNDGIMVVNGALHEKEFDVLQKINTQTQGLKEIKKRGKAQNSDHYWFTEAGVPCFFIYTMGGIKAYHDVYDVEKTLPLTEYVDVFKLLTEFVATF